MTQDVVHMSHMSPLAVAGLILGKAEVQGSNPCRGTMFPQSFQWVGGTPLLEVVRIMRRACG